MVDVVVVVVDVVVEGGHGASTSTTGSTILNNIHDDYMTCTKVCIH